MDLKEVNRIVDKYGIHISERIENNKASECYVRTVFKQANGFEWKTVVPYQYRRAGLFLETEKELAEYLIDIRPCFTKKAMDEWRSKEEEKWKKRNADVTFEFFKVLLSFKEETDFPVNDNPARRIQDIKEYGYTVASIPNSVGRKTSRIMLPIPLYERMGYETFSPEFKNRVIKLLGKINAYESRETVSKGLIPYHKFSEIRWDDSTKEINGDDMSDDDIIKKFQLLDNQRNQQKREVCRQCFQNGIRGSIYGIDYYYYGDRRWDANIPKIGKEAEKGCYGCPWYDIEAWRKALNEKLKNDKDQNIR